MKNDTNDDNGRVRSTRDDGLKPIFNSGEFFLWMPHVEDHQVQRTMREEELMRGVINLVINNIINECNDQES